MTNIKHLIIIDVNNMKLPDNYIILIIISMFVAYVNRLL